MSYPLSDDSACTPHPYDDPNNIIYCQKPGVGMLDHCNLTAIKPAPLPGIIIFVHGVNSDGEWYTESERGLCAGLNTRLKREKKQMAHPTAEGGHLTPATYMDELTADGYINPKKKFNKFMSDDDQFTPVIQFRWGYKANAQELQKYGDGIYLNEQNYWGGGPFANGCTALPDLWSDGLSENLFLWMHIQHLNPVPDRNVFACPPKPYFVLAALRLAKLVEAIRAKQADVPITIVCHSQGNMVGMAAAFIGDARKPVTDAANQTGRGVADTYVLCNPPYSLAIDNSTEDWTQSNLKDKTQGWGRQTGAARIGTLSAFFNIIRQPASKGQSVEMINQEMENIRHGFDAAIDRKDYGYGTTTCGRVTLYCNPHDEVISSLSVLGIGWRGMSAEEIKATDGAGVFSQRVFAQGHMVGKTGVYHYWNDHYRKPAPDSQGYWVPESMKVRYSVKQGLDANKGNFLAKIFTIGMAPFMIFACAVSGMRINALPHKDWQIPIDAPKLDEFLPQGRRFGKNGQFDQTYAPPGQSRAIDRAQGAGEPYTGDRPIVTKQGEEQREATDAAKGDERSEAALRYEDHARLRMQARREGLVKKTEVSVKAEDKLEDASPEYIAWRDKEIKTYLAANIDVHASDHSTIMTNGDHAEKALAYDVAIGVCQIRTEDLHKFRIAADWRYLKGLDEGDPIKEFEKYFLTGNFTSVSLDEWTRATNSEGRMPAKIVDIREHQPLSPRSHDRHGGHP